MQRNDACPIEHAAKIAIYPVRAKEKTEKVHFLTIIIPPCGDEA